MQRPPSRYFSYTLILMLVGSLFSITSPMQLSSASHENITVNIAIDDVTDSYEPDDQVAIEGLIDTVVENEDVIIKIGDPGDSSPNTVESDAPSSNGNFDFVYQVPGSGDEGVWTVEIVYDDESAYTYFIVDDQTDTISVDLDEASGIYDAGSDVVISGVVVADLESGEDFVEITVLDPANAELVNSVDAELGDGTLGDDEFEYEFSLPASADHGRYAVLVTYGVETELEGSILFEIEDDDSGGGGGSGDGDSDTDGDLSAGIQLATYEPGDVVLVEGTIDNYNSGDNEELSIVVEDPDGAEVDDYGDEDVNVQTDGDFDYDFNLANDAAEGEYTVIIRYDIDRVELTFDVEGDGGSTSTEDIIVKLNKASYLAGETMTVTGTVADVDEEEEVSILLYRPNGVVILEASRYVAPASNGAYSATITLDSDLNVGGNYTLVAAYIADQVEVTFGITGVSSTPADKMTVKTDKTTYSIGSTVRISGDVPDNLVVEGQKLYIRVNIPDGNPCRLDLTDVSATGSYSYSLVLGGKCGVAGEYDVISTYNSEEAKTTFELLGGSGLSAYPLKVEDDTYPIEYKVSSGTVKNMFVRPHDNKLVISINAEEDGQLTVVLPRQVIDAIENGQDIQYVVSFTDLDAGAGGNVDVEESDNNDEARTLVIDYKAGTDLIEISGTTVVPEFGPAAIVLAIAIVGIIVVTTRLQTRISSFSIRE